MEPLKKLSLLLESSTEATIRNALDCFLALLYKNWRIPLKRCIPLARCSMNLFGTSKQAFNIVGRCEAILFVGGRHCIGREEDGKIGFDWLKPVWDHYDEWPNVIYKYPNLRKLKAEVERRALQNRRYLIWHFSCPSHNIEHPNAQSFFLAFAVASYKDEGSDSIIFGTRR